jgi:N-acetylglucosamine malate deacetylase 1
VAQQASVLVVTAHPDDMEILCGGTVAKYRARGDEVTICHACSGHLGHMEIEPDVLVPMRWDEAQRGADIVGARHTTLGLDDLHVVNTEDVVCRLAGIMREARPTVILTHDPNDYMPDHSDLAEIVLKASFVATLPHYKGVDGEVWPVVPPVYFCDTLMGIGFAPEDYVDISDTIETKLSMLACHASQVDWLRDHDGIDVIANTRTVAQFRGLQCGVPYAEAFRKHHAWLRVTPQNPLP